MPDAASGVYSGVLGSVCQSYCLALTQQRTMEDTAIFPHHASADHGLSAVLARLGSEHLVIHDLLEALDGALVRPGFYPAQPCD